MTTAKKTRAIIMMRVALDDDDDGDGGEDDDADGDGDDGDDGNDILGRILGKATGDTSAQGPATLCPAG